jgi:hypothetical protein
MIDEDDFWSNWWNEIWQGKPKYSEKTYPIATLSTTKFHMTPGLEPRTAAVGSQAPHLSSRGWVEPVPDPLLLRKSGSAGNRTQDLGICSQELWPLDHRGGHVWHDTIKNPQLLYTWEWSREKWWWEYLNETEREDGENNMMRNFVISAVPPLIL